MRGCGRGTRARKREWTESRSCTPTVWRRCVRFLNLYREFTVLSRGTTPDAVREMKRYLALSEAAVSIEKQARTPGSRINRPVTPTYRREARESEVGERRHVAGGPRISFVQRLNQICFAAAPTTKTSIVRTASSLGSYHAGDGCDGRSAEVTDDEVGHGVRGRIGTAARAIEH
jgi:hypothetical protein